MSVVVAATPPADAPIVVLPIVTGLARLLLLIVATAGLLELQVGVAVTSPNEPSGKVAVAVNCWV